MKFVSVPARGIPEKGTRPSAGAVQINGNHRTDDDGRGDKIAIGAE